MPFEADSKAKEIENILSGKFEFRTEHWSHISEAGIFCSNFTAKQFIKAVLVVDPSKRLNAAQALKHPWIDPEIETPSVVDLLPNVRNGFNARKTFKKAVGVVKAVNNFSRQLSASLNSLGSENSGRRRYSTDDSSDSLHTALKHE